MVRQIVVFVYVAFTGGEWLGSPVWHEASVVVTTNKDDTRRRNSGMGNESLVSPSSAVEDQCRGGSEPLLVAQRSLDGCSTVGKTWLVWNGLNDGGQMGQNHE